MTSTAKIFAIDGLLQFLLYSHKKPLTISQSVMAVGLTPICQKESCPQSGSLEVAKLLIEKGADVNAKNADDITVLTMAEEEEIIKVLEDNGAEE